jgi:hypothetical protein
LPFGDSSVNAPTGVFGGKKMDKTDRIIEELQAKGFSMTKEELRKTKVYRILEAYDIEETLTIEEYLLLTGKLFLLCE